jgi:TorA maturation chaperone TorD
VRDPGLARAIDKAGGVAELARKIGIAQPSVSNWNRVPAQRVIAVEAATGISRRELRPDLYDASELAAAEHAVDPVDAGRAHQYLLLASLLSAPPSKKLLSAIAKLEGDDTPLGRAHGGLAEAAQNAVPAAVEREYFDLFIGVGRGEILPYTSYYLTGFLHERPLARLRGDLTAFGIERAENNPEPEDSAATLCEIMAGFADGRFAASHDQQQKFFEKHIAPWMGRMFADLEKNEVANFYRSVGALGRLFLEIETEAFKFAN